MAGAENLLYGGERHGLSWLVAADGDLPPVRLAPAGHSAPRPGRYLRGAQGCTDGSRVPVSAAVAAPLACQELIRREARQERGT